MLEEGGAIDNEQLTIDKSILNQETDLKGEDKQVGMYLQSDFELKINQINEKIKSEKLNDLKLKSVHPDWIEIDKNPLYAYRFYSQYETGGIGYTDTSYLKRNKERLKIKNEIDEKYHFTRLEKTIAVRGLINQYIEENANSSYYQGDESPDQAKTRYQRWIYEGRMTAEDAKAIIESAGLKVPDYLLIEGKNSKVIRMSDPHMLNGIKAKLQELSFLLEAPEPRPTVLSGPEIKFVLWVRQGLDTGATLNKLNLEKKADELGIRVKNQVKELAELAIVETAREISMQDKPPLEIYQRIVSLYHAQPNLSHRTSESIGMQQYSTSAPIAWLMGHFITHHPSPITPSYFEPSAGNGMLTIAVSPAYFIVNELDEIRSRHLLSQGFRQVLHQDGTKPFTEFIKYFDGVVTNPPFGSLDPPAVFDTYAIKGLEHLMVLRALETMKDDGRAAFIIGGHNEYDDEGRVKAGKNRIFMSYLFRHYNVVDIINIDGQKLYSRMGTSFDIRVVLIRGRKQVPGGFPPLLDRDLKSDEAFSSQPVIDFGVLYQRFSSVIANGVKQSPQ